MAARPSRYLQRVVAAPCCVAASIPMEDSTPSASTVTTVVPATPAAIMAAVIAPVPAVAAMITLASPETAVVPPADMARSHPVRARVRRLRPVPVAPAVVPALRVPVAFHPDVARAWRGSAHHDHVGRRRRCADLDAHGHLRVGTWRHTHQQQTKYEDCLLHVCVRPFCCLEIEQGPGHLYRPLFSAHFRAFPHGSPPACH